MKKFVKICLCILLGLFTLSILAVVVSSVLLGFGTAKVYEDTQDNSAIIDLTGEWIPVEGAKGTLKFGFGICTHLTPGLGGGYVDREYPYSVKGNHLYLDNEYRGVHSTSKIDCDFFIDEEGYLIINNVTGFAGKYKKRK